MPVTNKFTAPTLRGIILRDDDDQVIVQATREDIRTFAPQRGQEVRVQPAEVRFRLRQPTFYSTQALNPLQMHYLYGSRSLPSWPNYMTTGSFEDVSFGERESDEPGSVDPAGYLYDQRGRAVARVLEVTVNVRHEDMMTVRGAREAFEGGATLDIRAEGLPGVRLLR